MPRTDKAFEPLQFLFASYVVILLLCFYCTVFLGSVSHANLERDKSIRYCVCV